MAYKKESFDMFEAMMLRFQEDTARHLYRMQIIGPDGNPIETAEQLAVAQAQPAEKQEQLSLEGATQPPAPPVIATRPASTTIDALEREFQKKKERELERAKQSQSSSADASNAGPKRVGEKVGRNDKCPCGSGKKFKNCHGAAA